MGRHKWRRRLILLVILIIVGVIVLDPSRKVENHIADAAAGRADETIVGWMVERIAAGEVDLTDDGSIEQMFVEAERELGITLTQEDKKNVTGFLQTLGTIEVETGDFIEQAKVLYRHRIKTFIKRNNNG